MFKRLFWLVVGFVLGLGSSWAVMRRVRRAVARYAPSEVAGRWGDTARAARGDLRDAVSEGRAAMREREAELRAGLERGARGRSVERRAANDGQ